MAAACAEFIHADRLIYLTDVAGVLNGTKVIKVVSTADAEDLIRQNKVSGGMILKLEACKRALSAGVAEVRIVGGSVPKGLLTAANGTRFPGTRITSEFPAKRHRSGALKSKTKKSKTSARAKSASAAQSPVLRDASRHLMNTYKRSDMISRMDAAATYSIRMEKKYLDFLGGIAVNALGYSYPDLVRTIRREAGRAVHVSNLFHNPFQGPLAAKLAKWSHMDRVFFSNSGSEAIEGALKLARVAARKNPAVPKARLGFWRLKIRFMAGHLALSPSRNTLKYREPFEPLVPGVDFVRFITMSPTLKRNSTAMFARSSSSQCRARAEFSL